jgi:hypothetical protein
MPLLIVVAIAVLAFAASTIAEQTTRLGTVGEGPLQPGSALGGQLDSPAGVAVNRDGAGGVDAGSVFLLDDGTRRVTQFDAEGGFVRAFGRDVVSDGQGNTGANEQQTVTVNATGGLFKLNVTTGTGSAATTTGSSEITVRIGWGAYRVGDNYAGGNPAGRTITAVNGNVLTVSAPSTANGTLNSTASETVGGTGTGDLDGSTTVSNVATSAGSFEIGQAITGAGIPAGTTIVAVGSGSLTLSNPASAGSAVALNSGIPYNASPATVQALLEALPGVDPSDITVSGGPGGTSPYTFTFSGGIYDGNDVANLTTVTTGLLTGGAATATVATPSPGGGYEICRAVSSPTDVCQQAASTNAIAGSLGGITTGIAVDQDTGRIYVLDQSNRRISVYSPTGEFSGAFGWGVQNGAAALQVCTTATGCVAPPAAGVAAGQFPTQVQGLAVSPVDGHVYVAASGNRRIDEFAPTFTGSTLTGASFVRGIGADVVPGGATGLEVCTTTCQAGLAGSGPAQFPNTQPTAVSVDGAGAIYAVSTPSCNSTTNVCRVQKFSADGSSVSDFAPDQLTVTSGTNRASELAIDPNDGHVYVAQTVGTSQVKLKEFDPSGTLLSESPPSAPLPTGAATGVALDPDNSRSYVSGEEVFVLGPVPPPGAEMVEVTDITDSSAKFTAEVTVPAPGGDGFDTSYRFEYSKNGIDWTALPASQDISVGSTAGTQTVSQTASGLDANSPYSVRVRACTSDCTTSAPISFATDPAAPAVPLTFTEGVTKTAATLGAHINPRGSATTYHFEWGTTTAYGNRVPAVVERPIGSGSSRIVVREDIAGLQPSSEYHFRVVATNAAPDGTTIGPDQRFETLNDCGLTSGRCFELVSGDQGALGEAAISVESGVQLQAQRSVDGLKVAYVMAHGNDAATSGSDVLYQAERNEDGWEQRQLSPSVTWPGGGYDRTEAAETSRHSYLSKNLDCGFVSSPLPLAEGAPVETIEAGVRNLFRQNPNGTYTTLTTAPPTNPEAGGTDSTGFYIIGASEDCNRVYFITMFKYPGVDATAVGNIWNLYEWHDGQIHNAAVIPGASGPVPATGASPGAITANTLPQGYFNAVSDNGRQLVFSATSAEGPDAGRTAVFLRDDGDTGVNISRTQTATPDRGALYQDASEDGRRVLFLANYGLTGPVENGATTNNDCASGQPLCDLYLYDHDAPEGDRLTNLTDSTAAGSPNPAGAAVLGVLDSSDDAKSVYFAAQGQLVPGMGNSYEDNLEGVGHYNVYRVDSETGELTFVGLVSQRDFSGPGDRVVAGLLTSPRGSVPERESWSSQASSNGSYFVFQTQADAIGGGEDGGVLNAYLYSEESGETVCVSCRPDLQTSAGLADPQDAIPLTGRYRLQSNYLSPIRNLSEDGRVMFLSRDTLAAGAVEGDDNVYEWHDGQVTLITRGAPIGIRPGAQTIGISPDGKSLFVATDEALTGWDADGRRSLYAARIGGGFGEPDPPAAGCDPEMSGSCQGPSLLVPTPALPMTQVPSGGQDQPAVRTTFAVGGLGRLQRARLANGRKIGLVVRVNKAGVVSVAGNARVAGFRTQVLSAKRRLSSAGRVVIPLRLSKAARLRIAATGALRVRLVVTFDGAAKSSVRQLALRKQRPLENNRRAAR